MFKVGLSKQTLERHSSSESVPQKIGLVQFKINKIARLKTSKKFCALFVLLIAALNCFAQQEKPEQGLIMYRTFGGAAFEYTKDTTTFYVSPKQVLQIMNKDNSMAYEEFKKGRKLETAAGVMGFVGGVLVLFPIGSAIAGADPEWSFLAAGGALIAGSIPLHRSYKRHAQNAIDTYNKGLPYSMRPKPSLFFSRNAVGIQLKF